MKTARIVILNFNGEAFLKKNLPSIVAAARQSKYPCAITVLDNVSSDQSEESVRAFAEAVSWVPAPRNEVLCSYNAYLKQISEDVAILLNNDLTLDPDAVSHLVDEFEKDPELFFASTRLDRSSAGFHWGVLTASFDHPEYRRTSQKRGETLSSGIAAFDRLKFIELGGYDPMYLPGRYEDMDLCFRAWKRGWKGIHVPEAIMHHEGYGSFKRYYSQKQIETLVFRNSLLFMIKNISSVRLWAGFLAGLAVRLPVYALTFRWHFLKGFAQAVARVRQAWAGRKRTRVQWKLSDEEVIQKVNRTQFYQGPRSVRWMKRCVHQMDRYAWLRSIGLGFCFWFVRPFCPLQYFILRELMDCSSVLDLGCGNHSMVPILPTRIETVGVEGHRPYYEESVSKGRHDRYVFSDIREVSFEPRSFDAVVAMDVIEHLTPEDGQRLIEQMKLWARKKVILFTPNGFMCQDEYDGNPLMKHRSGWTAAQMAGMGFKVYGVNGFKKLKSSLHHHEEHQKSFRETLVDLTQWLTYYWPAQAYQIFCVLLKP